MAVYTELSFEEIAAHLHLYDLPALKAAEGIRAGVENTNYRLTLADDTRLILTLFEKRTNVADLPFFMALMENLALHDIPCPKPLHAKDGSVTGYMREKPAALVTFLEGKSVGTILPQHVSELGTYLAKMHLATHGATLPPRANALSLEGWQKLAAHILPKIDTLGSGLAQEISAELEVLKAHWPDELPEGVIHADLFPDNVFFDKNQRLSGLIDFYFACDDMYAYDLAICLNAWCFDAAEEGFGIQDSGFRCEEQEARPAGRASLEPAKRRFMEKSADFSGKHYAFNIAKARALLASYTKVRPLNEAEMNALPLLARGAALRFLLTRAHDKLFPAEGALVTPKDPLEYRAKLRFHQRVQNTKEYGL